MALKEVSMNVEYVKWDDVAKDAVIEGFFMDQKPSKNYPESLNTYIETKDGKLYGLNTPTVLKNAMEQIGRGWFVRITYLGKEVNDAGKFKGRESHRFKVAYDDECVHPKFQGQAPDTSVREPVAYKQDQQAEEKPADKPAPALVKPEANAPKQETPKQESTDAAAAASTSTPAASAANAAPAAAKPKRGVF